MTDHSRNQRESNVHNPVDKPPETSFDHSVRGDDNDEIRWLHPSVRLQTLRRGQVAAVAVVMAAVGVGVALSQHEPEVALLVAAAVVLAAVAALVFVTRRVQAWGFAERNEDLLVRRGVMFRRLAVIPYGRMQYLEVTAGPFERSVGLATVQMHTAAAARDAKIPGLPAAEAARLRDQLSSLGESQAAGL
jgi:membrane protein YdbS with pleckstrin-like domain